MPLPDSSSGLPLCLCCCCNGTKYRKCTVDNGKFFHSWQHFLASSSVRLFMIWLWHWLWNADLLMSKHWRWFWSKQTIEKKEFRSITILCWLLLYIFLLTIIQRCRSDNLPDLIDLSMKVIERPSGSKEQKRFWLQFCLDIAEETLSNRDDSKSKEC